MLKTTVFQSGRSANITFMMTLTWNAISSLIFLFIFVGIPSTTKAQRAQTSVTGPQEFCHLETFNASCPHDTVIVMQSARYGRMKVGHCVKRNLGYVGCAVDVMRYMDAQCSGRSSCRVSIVDLAKTEMKPCPEDVTSYLEASYQCLPVQAGSTRHCSNHKQQRLPPTGGYLASALVTDRGFGSSRCPWIITVQPGQRINITLHNFARTTTIATSNTQGGGRRSDACYEFALVRESEGKKSIVGCVGDQRETAVYTSTTNSVQIYVLDRVISSQTVYFLLEYSVIGCSVVPQIKGAIVETKGTTATIKCNNTGEVWYLTCKGREWIGDFNNCSLSSQWTLGDIFEETDFPYGILIVVAIGVALGVFFGGLLLFTISMFLKRNHTKQGRNNRDNAYNEAIRDEHVMISEPDYSTGLIQKATDCPRTHVPVHCTETSTPVSTAMSLKRGTTTAQYGPDGLPPPPSFLLTTKSQGHHYESPTFT